MDAEEIRKAIDLINKTYGISDEDHETGLETGHYLGIIIDLQSQLEKHQSLIESAIMKVDGFANWYMLQEGLTQEQIDKSVREGVEYVNELIKNTSNPK